MTPKLPKLTRAQARRALDLIPEICGGPGPDHHCVHNEAMAEVFAVLLEKLRRFEPLPHELEQELAAWGTTLEIADAIIIGTHFGYALALAQGEELGDDDAKAN